MRSVTSAPFTPDGIQEVFAAVGESASLSCGNTSSLGVGGRMQWDLGGKPLREDVSLGKGQPQTFHVNQDSSLVISKVSALHSGNYRCSWPADEQKVINKIRLHTFDSEYLKNTELQSIYNALVLNEYSLWCLCSQLLQSPTRTEIISP